MYGIVGIASTSKAGQLKDFCYFELHLHHNLLSSTGNPSSIAIAIIVVVVVSILSVKSYMVTWLESKSTALM